MSASINANANVVGTANGSGGYDYTITLNDTGSTPIGTFWFSWVPGAAFMIDNPTSVGYPSGWSEFVFPIGSGYSIEWTANSSINYIQPTGSSSAFTFSSTETPAQMAANSPLASSIPTTTSFVYSAANEGGTGLQITPTVGSNSTPVENATATLTPQLIGPGLFQYTVSLTDTGNTPIHTFWFAWDDVPDQDFMSVQPSNIGSPTGWSPFVTTHQYPGGGTGYGIEWISSSTSFDLSPNSTNSTFTFDSTETPTEFAGTQQFNDPSFGTTFQTTSSFVYSGTAEATPGGNLIATVECFRAGTRIRTPSGDVAIEALHPGDLVVTATGETRPVRWAGQRRVVCRQHRHPEQMWPIRVAAYALGPHTPSADLYLSPDHALFLNGVLVPVKYLINGSSIAPVPTDLVIWHHLELDSHDVILAEGAPVESYLDTGDHSRFENEVILLFPGAAAPGRARVMREAGSDMALVVTGPILTAIRRRLAKRADMLARVAPDERAA